ncbi:MAG: hypothetical protein JHC26_02190 [Thermofilum sp.]|jgi:hypothetical protein|uniref:hypothetical protein n=1 Tax=Thermofilum sp. TaxID=1961369 RepID=UPI00258FD97E|nr:hypothetical protein [Thermofilum sp.]MCI4407874.1 hypothetical protein [Thermofilum sp.]
MSNQSNQQVVEKSEKTTQEQEKFVIINLEKLSKLAGLCDDFFALTRRFFYHYTGMSYYGAIEMPFSGKADFHSVIPFTDEEIARILDIVDGKIESISIEDMMTKIYNVVIQRVKRLEEDPDLKGLSEKVRLIYFTDGYDAVIYIVAVRPHSPDNTKN